MIELDMNKVNIPKRTKPMDLDLSKIKISTQKSPEWTKNYQLLEEAVRFVKSDGKVSSSQYEGDGILGADLKAVVKAKKEDISQFDSRIEEYINAIEYKRSLIGENAQANAYLDKLKSYITAMGDYSKSELSKYNADKTLADITVPKKTLNPVTLEGMREVDYVKAFESGIAAAKTDEEKQYILNKTVTALSDRIESLSAEFKEMYKDNPQYKEGSFSFETQLAPDSLGYAQASKIRKEMKILDLIIDSAKKKGVKTKNVDVFKYNSDDYLEDFNENIVLAPTMEEKEAVFLKTASVLAKRIEKLQAQYKTAIEAEGATNAITDIYAADLKKQEKALESIIESAKNSGIRSNDAELVLLSTCVSNYTVGDRALKEKIDKIIEGLKTDDAEIKGAVDKAQKYIVEVDDSLNKAMSKEEEFYSEHIELEATAKSDKNFGEYVKEGQKHFSEGIGVIDTKYIADSELEVYFYWLGRRKTAPIAAQNYMESLKPLVEMRKGFETAKWAEGSFVAQELVNVAANLEKYGTDIINAFSLSDEYFAPTALQYANSAIYEDLGSENTLLGRNAGQWVHSAVGTMTYMAPSMALSLVPYVGQALSLASIGLSAKGGAYAESINSGHSALEAQAYSIAVGVSEALLEKYVGKIPGLSKVGKVDDLIKGIGNAYVRFAAQTGWGMVREGAEEALQEILDPIFKNIAYLETDNTVDWQEVAFAGALGAFTGLFLNGAPTAAEIISTDARRNQIGALTFNFKLTEQLINAAKASDNNGLTRLAQRIENNFKNTGKPKNSDLKQIGQLYDGLQEVQNAKLFGSKDSTAFAKALKAEISSRGIEDGKRAFGAVKGAVNGILNAEDTAYFKDIGGMEIISEVFKAFPTEQKITKAIWAIKNTFISQLQTAENGGTIDSGSDSYENNRRGNAEVARGQENGIPDTQTERAGAKSYGKASQYDARVTNGIDAEEPGALRRISLKGNNGGSTDVSYTVKASDDSGAYRAVQIFESKGYAIKYCDGAIIIEVNGKTTEHHNAVTLEDGTVLVSSNCKGDPQQVFDHEEVHIHQRLKTAAFDKYIKVLSDNFIKTSEDYLIEAKRINKEHFNGRYSQKQLQENFVIGKIMKEVIAYLRQCYNFDSKLAQKNYAGMFKNWTKIASAIEIFNNDTNKMRLDGEINEIFLKRRYEGNKEGQRTDPGGKDEASFLERGNVNRGIDSGNERRPIRRINDTEKATAEESGAASFMPEKNQEGDYLYEPQTDPAKTENAPTDEISRDFWDLEDTPTEIAGISLLNSNKKRHHLNNAQQNEVKSLCENLGVKVKFVDLQKYLKEKGKRVNRVPDGMVLSDGTILINYYTSKPAQFVLKHEISDMLSKDLFAFKELSDVCIKSVIFGKWLQNQDYSSIEQYKNSIIAERKAAGDPNFKTNDKNELQLQAEIEMISNFIGDNCFGGSESLNGFLEAIKAAENKNPFKKVWDWLKSIISRIDSKAKPTVFEKELKAIEKQFAKAFVQVQKKNTLTDSGVVRYSMAKPFENQVDDVLNGEHNPRLDLYVSETPKYLVDLNFSDSPLLMRNGKIAEILKKHPEMSEDLIKKIPESIKNPLLVIKSKTHPTESVVVITDILTAKGEMIVPIWVNQEGNYIDFDLVEISEKSNFAASSYGRNIAELIRYANENDGFLYQSEDIEKVKQLLARNGLQLPTPLKLSDSDIIISQSDIKSQDNYMQQGENNSESQDNNERFSFPMKNEGADIDLYTEAQYNNYGWVRANEVLTAGEYNQFGSYFADHKIHKHYYVKTRNDESIIPVGKNLDVLVYASGTIKNPKISKVVRINENNDYFVSQIRSDILEYEKQGHYQPYRDVKIIYGEEVFVEKSFKDCPTLQEFKRQRKGKAGTQNNLDSGIVRERAGSARENTEAEADLNESAFSMPKTERFSFPAESIEDLITRYDNGEITKEQLTEVLSKKRPKNPVEIANMTEEDAQMPQLNRKTGKAPGNKQSNTYESLQESDIFGPEFKIQAKGDDFIKKYQSVTNHETLLKAAEELDEGGRAYVDKWWAKDSAHASLIDVAVGFILMDRYQRIGDIESSVAAAEKLREMGTASGQKVQIFSILGRLTPASMAVYAQKELSKAFENMAEKRTAKWIEANKSRFELTEKEIEFIRRNTLYALKLPEGREKAILLAEISQLIQDKLPPEKGQALKAWQRISMLMNPKTQIRNITGNAGMVLPFIASDFFGTAADKLLQKKTGVRTTGNFNPVSAAKGFQKGAFETLDDYKRHIHTKASELNRFEVGRGKSFNERNNETKALNEIAKILNGMDSFTSFMLEMGDRPFYEAYFINSLNNQMKLNNVSEPTPEMVEIATQEGLQRTWQNTNSIVSVVGQFKSVLNEINIGGYGLGDVFIKFVKTPANLTKAVFDFSPLGVAKAITADAIALKRAVDKGKGVAQAQKAFVTSFSNGITGTLVYLLVIAASGLGYITISGAGDEDRDVRDFEQNVNGMPPYSIKIGGHKWSTYDWAQPMGAIVATVADYMQNRKENPENPWYNDAWDALQTGGTVLYNQSFMKSIQNLFTGENIVVAIGESLLDEFSVMIPTFLSQIASATDDYARVTYDNESDFNTALNNVKYKIPGLRQTLERKTDILGRDVPNSRNNIWDAFFNPANTYTDTSNEITNEIYDLYEQTGNKSVIPPKAPNKVTAKGQNHVLSNEEKRKYQQTAGKTASKMIEAAIKSEAYEKLDDAQKVKFVQKIYEYSTAKAKSEISYPYEMLDKMAGGLKIEWYETATERAKTAVAEDYFMAEHKKAATLEKDSDALCEYFIARTVISVAFADEDNSGGVSKKEKIAAMKKYGISVEVRKAVLS